jgi:hypothetical protein
MWTRKPKSSLGDGLPILVFIGLVLLLIPYAGIMLALVWCFAMLLVVAKDAVRLVHLEIRIRIEYSPRSSGSGTAECGAAELRRTLILWSKQFYHYIVADWRKGDPAQPPPPPERLGGRNREWDHVYSRDIISMPDKWEYPWFAAWDLAFHMVPMACVDPDFAKQQLVLFLREWYMHPNGQIPAYTISVAAGFGMNPTVFPAQ